jgi:DNA replicative helicase MCM subunit Mcm2 (Cdc46/Mcm family)
MTWKQPERPDSAHMMCTACRSMTVHVRGDLTRSMKPGDHVVITGVYLPQPVMRRGRNFAHTLLQTTVLHATDVQQLKESYTEHIVTEEVRLPPGSHPSACGVSALGRNAAPQA